jgi:predicted porin
MKKLTLIPAAMLLAALGGPAAAQSTVTIYGIVDAGVEAQRASAGSAGPATSSRQMVNGTFAMSRLGFRGSEDLGGGLRAFFQLEHGFNSDDGGLTGAIFWGRKSIVGLGGAWGEISFGRDYTPGFWVQFFTDINAFAMYGNAGTMSAFALTGMLRTNNGIYYVSPEIGGFRGRLTYSFGDERSAAPKDAGQVIGLSGEYRSATLSAGAYHQRRKTIFPANGTSTEDNVYEGLTARYDFSAWALSGGITRFDPAGPDTATAGVVKSLWAGVLVKLPSSDLRINLGRVKTSLAGPVAGKSTLAGVNYSYYLSKRSNVYIGAGRVSNNESAQFALEGGSRAIPNNGRGSDTTAFAAGIRTTF